MDQIISQDKIFIPHTYSLERDFEGQIIKHAKEIFGSESLYIDVKKRISNDNIVTIPDGYLLDFFFASDPRLYIIENELSIHDPYKHIGQQLLKFAISYKASGRKIKKFLLETILKDQEKATFVNERLRNAGYRNIDAFFEDIIFEKPVAAIVVIDELTTDLENVLTQLSMRTDIIEFNTYVSGKEQIHKFTPFQQDVLNVAEFKVKVEDLDTIVVPAKADGFAEVFLGQNSWYAIRVSSSMLDRIKYIAGYQTAPVSAITHYAEVARIEKYKETSKYIVYFNGPAQDIGPLKLPKGKKGIAPQAPRYTNFQKLIKAKTLSDIF